MHNTQIIMGNLFTHVAPAPEEFLEILASGKSDTFRIERIVSHGHVSPPDFWYNQDEWEFVVVLQGNAELEFSDGKFAINVGDWLIIPEHVRHRVTFTSSEPDCVWLAVFGKTLSCTTLTS